MNIENALAFAGEQLIGTETPALDARRLLRHVLAVDETYLLAHGDDALPNAAVAHYFALVARAEKHEPLPYIIGRAPFRFLELAVTPDVLIPRPETEQLVDLVLRWARGRSDLTLVDVGTGSGCIAISLATELSGANVIATDLSAAALAVARANAAANAAPVTFRHGSLLMPLTAPVDAIVANLPYIADGEWPAVDGRVKSYEPVLALRGGPDGLDLVRSLLQQATSRLRPGGAIFLEIGWQQGTAARQLAQQLFPAAHVRVAQDYAGHDRFVTIETTGATRPVGR